MIRLQKWITLLNGTNYKKILDKMSQIIINGKNYSGNSIIISGNKVVVNGVDVTPDSKQINIKVEGNISELKVDSCDKIDVIGDVSNIKSQSGDIKITGNVNGSVNTMSGDVDCGAIGGSVNTMSGDITHKR